MKRDMDLSNHSTFDWRQFPEGPARFSGGVRGIMDEQRHEAFAAEVDGEEHVCEVRNALLSNGNDCNLEIRSFGYGRDGDSGTPMPGACRAFAAAEARTIQTLIDRLVAAGMHYPTRPVVLRRYPDAHFMGQVFFKDGGIIARHERHDCMH